MTSAKSERQMEMTCEFLKQNGRDCGIRVPHPKSNVTQRNDLAVRTQNLTDCDPRKRVFGGRKGLIQFLVKRTKTCVRWQTQRAMADSFQRSDGIHNVKDRDFIRRSGQRVATARSRPGTNQLAPAPDPAEPCADIAEEPWSARSASLRTPLSRHHRQGRPRYEGHIQQFSTTQKFLFQENRQILHLDMKNSSDKLDGRLIL